VAELIRAGEDLKVVENDSGKDITATTIALIIFEEQFIEMQARSTSVSGARGKAICRSRLSGMLNFYCREAA
jgi:hypothetical protein